MQRSVSFTLFISCALTVVLAGCGGEKLNRPPVFKVTGKVTLSGKPVANADVTFIHDESKRAAFGKTNAEGVYKLTTFAANDGAVEGKHSIKVVDIPAPAATPASPTQKARNISLRGSVRTPCPNPNPTSPQNTPTPPPRDCSASSMRTGARM